MVLLDANQGKNGKPAKNPKSPGALVNQLSAMNQYVAAWNATDDEVQEILDTHRTNAPRVRHLERVLRQAGVLCRETRKGTGTLAGLAVARFRHRISRN